jgi:GT2 family glycosyltransferase
MTGVAIVIINWNNWLDTIECLESVFRNRHPEFMVIVVDNGSTDGSIDRILEWAEGSYVDSSLKGGLEYLVDPPVSKPIQCQVLDPDTDDHRLGISSQFLIIKTGTNLGFAGGNNVALRFLMNQDGWRYVWLLNNDTVIEPEALTALVRRMDMQPSAGMCGSLLPYYSKPDIIWAQGGGTYNRWLAKSHCIGNGLPLNRQFSQDDVEKRMAYVAGASLLVSRQFLEDVGLMCEDYFLYFEEPDWAFRAKGKYQLAYTSESVIYHKVGVSTQLVNKIEHGYGSPHDFIFRSSLRFTRTFFPTALPLVFVRCAVKWIFARIGTLVQHIWSRS